MNNEIYLGVGMFTGIIMILVFVILYARKLLVSTGEVSIEINADPAKTILSNRRLAMKLPVSICT